MDLWFRGFRRVVFYSALLFSLGSAAAPVAPAYAGNPDGACELTKSSVSDYDSLSPEDLSVLGIHLGMSQIRAKRQIARKAAVYLRQDKFYNSRLYLYEYKGGNAENQPLAYMKWDKAGEQLQEIMLYPQFANYMPDGNDYLVSPKVLKQSVSPNHLALGAISKQESLLNIPSQDLAHTAFYFLKPGFRCIKQVKGRRTRYAFSWFRTDDQGKPLPQ